MSFEETVFARRSVRGFLDKPVPQELMNHVFEVAARSPSGTNLQPWETCVASGATRDYLRSEFMDRVSKGVKPNTDHQSDGKLSEHYKERRRGCARVLYDAMGIAWEDKPARAKAGFRNFELFDAPHVAFFCIHESFGVQSACDVGMYTQTLMLAMTANGLASCAQGTMRNYPDLVREVFDLPPEMKVLYGLSFGYEDVSMPVNKAYTERAALAENVHFKSELKTC